MNGLFEKDEPKRDGPVPVKAASTPVVPIFDQPVVSLLDADASGEPEPYVLSEGKPLSVAETVRSSGLAWSAAIALFAAVIVMLIIGWGADLLFGSSPWGIVIGIVIGALIGFIQFFRITSEIFKK
jgi:Putative F0F1-ATPase subunit Ca2+/Mg2+ transporter